MHAMASGDSSSYSSATKGKTRRQQERRPVPSEIRHQPRVNFGRAILSIASSVASGLPSIRFWRRKSDQFVLRASSTYLFIWHPPRPSVCTP